MTSEGFIQKTQKNPKRMKLSVRGNGMPIGDIHVDASVGGTTLRLYFLITRLGILHFSMLLARQLNELRPNI